MRTHWEQGKRIPSPWAAPPRRKKNWTSHECMLSLLSGCMKIFIFQNCLLLFLGSANRRGHKLQYYVRQRGNLVQLTIPCGVHTFAQMLEMSDVISNIELITSFYTLENAQTCHIQHKAFVGLALPRRGYCVTIHLQSVVA